MTISVFNIGSNTANTSSGTISVNITVPSGGIPAGSLIFGFAYNSNSNVTSFTATDSASNSYHNPITTAVPSTRGNCYVVYAFNTAALSSGQTISFNFTVSGFAQHIAASAGYATGVLTSADPYDTGFAATASNTSANSSVSSASAPAVANSLIVGAVGVFQGGPGNDVNYTSPPLAAAADSGSTAAIVGGWKIDSVISTYATSVSGGASKTWASAIVAFSPSAPIPVVPEIYLNPKRIYSAPKLKAFRLNSWDYLQPPPPPEAETNTNFIAKFRIRSIPRLNFNYFNSDIPPPPPIQPDSPVNFIGKFIRSKFNRFKFNFSPEDVSSSTPVNGSMSSRAGTRGTMTGASTTPGTVLASQVVLETLIQEINFVHASQVVLEVLVLQQSPSPTAGCGPIPIFPTLPQGFPVKWKPTFKTTMGEASSGREVRVANQNFGLHEFEVEFPELRDRTQNQVPTQFFINYQQYMTLCQFWLQMYGKFGLFYFDAPWDDSREDQFIATGDGVTEEFVVYRTFGTLNGFLNEPVGAVNVITNVKFDGIIQDPGIYTSSGNLLIFNYTPPPGTTITMTFSFYYLCKFMEDQQDFEEFMLGRWTTKVKFRSVFWPLPM